MKVGRVDFQETGTSGTFLNGLGNAESGSVGLLVIANGFINFRRAGNE